MSSDPPKEQTESAVGPQEPLEASTPPTPETPILTRAEVANIDLGFSVARIHTLCDFVIRRNLDEEQATQLLGPQLHLLPGKVNRAGLPPTEANGFRGVADAILLQWNRRVQQARESGSMQPFEIVQGMMTTLRDSLGSAFNGRGHSALKLGLALGASSGWYQPCELTGFQSELTWTFDNEESLAEALGLLSIPQGWFVLTMEQLESMTYEEARWIDEEVPEFWGWRHIETQLRKMETVATSDEQAALPDEWKRDRHYPIEVNEHRQEIRRDANSPVEFVTDAPWALLMRLLGANGAWVLSSQLRGDLGITPSALGQRKISLQTSLQTLRLAVDRDGSGPQTRYRLKIM